MTFFTKIRIRLFTIWKCHEDKKFCFNHDAFSEGKKFFFNHDVFSIKMTFLKQNVMVVKIKNNI